MDELTQRIVDARAHVDVGWDEAHGERELLRLRARLRRRRVARGGIGVAGLLAAAALLLVLWPRIGTPEAVSRPGGPVQMVRLSDGSTATGLDGRSELVVLEATEGRVLIELGAGSARFDVVRGRDRVFVVRAGEVTVRVLGTQFDVAREGGRVRVAVSRGRVAVEWPGDDAVLEAGEEGSFPPPEGAIAREPEEPTAVAELEEPADPAPVRRQAERPSSASPPDWRALAERADFHAAFEALAAGAAPEADDPSDLMLAADAARLSGHPTEAVDYLREVTARHRGDRRAPLAAFTVGRLLLGELGRPEQAAAAFAETRALDPGGPLAQDALAREVEAWDRAGEHERARTLAEEYLRAYPDGLHAAGVRRHGGL